MYKILKTRYLLYEYCQLNEKFLTRRNGFRVYHKTSKVLSYIKCFAYYRIFDKNLILLTNKFKVGYVIS